MKKTIILGCVSMLVLTVLKASAFESAPNAFYAGSTYSGHEEITRQALNNISKKIKEVDKSNTIFDLKELNFDLAPEAKGLFGYKAKNLVINGNFATDFPKQTSVLSLEDFWKIKNFDAFENPKTQSLHFLKNYKTNLSLESAKTTCEQARSAIKYVTGEALKAWDAGDKTKALFLIGHATHTIQDSFSPAHTQRDGADNNYNLKNVCYFGTEMQKHMDTSRMGPKDLCYHNAPDSRDAVWNISGEQYKAALSNWSKEKASQCDKGAGYPQTDEEKTSCLSSDARLARVATEKYLFLVFNQMSPSNITKKSNDDLVSKLDTNLFDGPVGVADLDQKMAKGIMRCDGLPTNEIIGYDDINNFN